MVYNIIIIILGFILLIKGADFLVKGSTRIAKRFNISEMLIGIVIIGLGTSLPEILITIKSSISGHPDLILGNAIGSAVCNLLLVIGIASICRSLKMDKRLVNIHLPISLAAITILFIVSNFFGNLEINIIESFILGICTVLYVIYTAFEGKKENKDNKKILNKEFKNIDEKKEFSIVTIIVYMIFGVVGLKFGSDFVVDSAVNIARSFSISETLISLTIIAIGTALPEIVTSIVASIKKDADLAVGNVIGSNIYNLLLLPAIGGIISPIKYDAKFNINLFFIAVICIYIMLSSRYGKNKDVITRKKGIMFVIIYFVYLVILTFVT